MTPLFSFSPGFLRAWAVFGVVFVLVLSQGSARAQSSDSSSTSSGADSSSASTSGNTAQGTVATPEGGVAPDGTMPSPSGEARVPPPTSLQTGQPLLSAISPLRWSHLSLLSLTASGIYDNNLDSSKQSVGSAIGMIQALAVFSIRRNRSALDLQYRPSIWYTNGHLNKDWAGHLVDLQTSFALTPSDTLTFTDQFHYTPSRNPLTDQGFNANFTNFLLQQNPFLLQGTTALVNNFSANLTHVLDGSNRLEFRGTQEFVKLTQPPVTPQPHIICIPGLPFCIIEPGPPPKGEIVQVQPSMNLTAKWVHEFDARTNFSLDYGFLKTWLRGTYETNTQSHHIGAGYSRGLTETVMLTLEGGPTLFQSQPLTTKNVPSRSNVGLQGEATIFKHLRRGGIAASIQRQYNFAGQFSDSAHTTLEGTIDQHFTPKFGVNGGGVLIRQEFSNHTPNYGYNAWGGVSYNLSRSWSVFSRYNYVHLTNSAQAYAPRSSVYGGVRWGWSPDEPRD